MGWYSFYSKDYFCKKPFSYSYTFFTNNLYNNNPNLKIEYYTVYCDGSINDFCY